jgi:hypothetical protein
MPVHIEEMTTEVSVHAGDLPLTEAQIEQLVKIVMKRLADKQRDAQRVRDATQLKRQSTAPFELGA